MSIGRPPKTVKLQTACLECGTIIYHYPWEKRKYCSKRCADIDRSGRANPRKPPEERKCLHCGKPFLVGGGHHSRVVRYCTLECAHYARGVKHATAREMSETECAWFAGLFDGEGSIAWPRRNNVRSVRLDLSQTNLELIEKIISVVGAGKISEQKRHSDRHSRTWTWHVYGENAQRTLRQIHPWLIVKRHAAEVALGIIEAETPPWTQRSKTANLWGANDPPRVKLDLDELEI